MERSENRYFIFEKPEVFTVKSVLRWVRDTILAFYYKFRMNLIHTDNRTEKQYKVAICAIFKNEAPYLKEWIEFHRIVGVEHFYLYNNNSEDDYLSVLRPYVKSGDVTLTEWPYSQGQISSYVHCIKEHRKDVKWIGFIDLDEFVVPKDTKDIYSFLKRFEKNRSAVLIYWKMFGSAGYLERDRKGLVIEDIHSCWTKYYDVGKCFYNTNYDFDEQNKRVSKLNHCFWATWKGLQLPPVNIFDSIVVGRRHVVTCSDFPIQINHYVTKSYEEYCLKKSRGDAFYKINPRDDAYFFLHEMNCMATDHAVDRYLILLKQKLRGSN